MKKIIVYTAPSCPYCVRAKDLLKRRNISYEEVALSWDNISAWRELEKKSGMKTVPQIFLEDKCLGGFTELSALDQSGELEKLLSSN